MYNVYIYLKCIDLEIQFSNYTHISLVGCVLCPIDSEVI